MKMHLDKLIEIINSREDWVLPDKHALDVFEPEPLVYVVGDCNVPEHDLSELHHDFPAFLRSACMVYPPDDMDDHITLAGDTVCDGLQVLLNGTIDVVDSGQLKYHFLEIHEINDLAHDQEHIVLTGLRAIFVSDIHRPELGTVFSHVGTCSITAPKAQFDSSYPNWMLRWNIGKELELETLELSRYVFSLSPSLEQCLHNIELLQ